MKFQAPLKSLLNKQLNKKDLSKESYKYVQDRHKQKQSKSQSKRHGRSSSLSLTLPEEVLHVSAIVWSSPCPLIALLVAELLKERSLSQIMTAWWVLVCLHIPDTKFFDWT